MRADPFDHWTLVTNGLPTNVAAIAYGNEKFVAVGSNAPTAGWILVSTDLEHWTPAVCQDHLCSPRALLGVTFANGRFIAVGNYGWTYTSTDAADWRLNVVPPSDSLLFDINYGQGTFTAVGDVESCPCGFVATSSDGATWSPRFIEEIRYLRGVAFGKGELVTVGLSDLGLGYTRTNIFSSTNLFASWQSHAATQTNDLFSVAYGNGAFVAAGQEHHAGTGRIIMSTDGEVWTESILPTTNALRNVSFVQGVFFATGTSGTLLTSTNGLDWRLRQTFTTYSLGRSFLALKSILTITEQGAWLQSDPLLSLQVTLSTDAELIVSGLEGRTYRIESTESLASSVWDAIGSFVLYSSPTLWRDGRPRVNTRFYRAALLP